MQPIRDDSTKDLLAETLTVILAGGVGQRLYPLTRDRAKPAVPFGGIYRIIDFALSNCLNSGLRRIYLLTQYKSLSLDRHITLGWNIFNHELNEYIFCVPPQQRLTGTWYRGTADAIYQNLYTLEHERPRNVLILAGDHIYKMNYRRMIEFHQEKNADLTVACFRFPSVQAQRFGVATVNEENRIVEFHEKPAHPQPMPGSTDESLVSMGIYVFDTETLVRQIIADAKTDSEHDFGKNIIPSMVRTHRVFAFPFQEEDPYGNYWRDIGTIDAYWQANMDLLRPDSDFNLYDRHWPIRTYQEQHPPTKIIPGENGKQAVVNECFLSNGCVVRGARIYRSILSANVVVEEGADVQECVLMEGVHVGRNARLRRTIVDKGMIVPPEAEAGLDPALDRRRFTVTDGGIVVVPKEITWPVA